MIAPLSSLDHIVQKLPGDGNEELLSRVRFMEARLGTSVPSGDFALKFNHVVA